MAKMIIHTIIDDLDGGDADESVNFSLDGVLYEIDLSKGNADKFREALAPYVAVAQKVKALNGRPAKPGAVYQGGTVRASVSNDKAQNKAIREWAKRQGKDIADRGRIPQEVVDEYHANAGRNTMTIREVPLPEPEHMATGTGAAMAVGVRESKPVARKAAAASSTASKTTTAKLPANDGKRLEDMTLGELRAYAVKAGMSTGTKAPNKQAMIRVIRLWEDKQQGANGAQAPAKVAAKATKATARKATAKR